MNKILCASMLIALSAGCTNSFSAWMSSFKHKVKPLKPRVGTTFSVLVKGDNWRFSKIRSSKNVALVDEEVHAESSTSGVITQQLEFTFKAVSRGDAILTFYPKDETLKSVFRSIKVSLLK